MPLTRRLWTLKIDGDLLTTFQHENKAGSILDRYGFFAWRIDELNSGLPAQARRGTRDSANRPKQRGTNQSASYRERFCFIATGTLSVRVTVS